MQCKGTQRSSGYASTGATTTQPQRLSARADTAWLLAVTVAQEEHVADVILLLVNLS